MVIAASLNGFSIRWCKQEYVEPDVLMKEWKVIIFRIMDSRINKSLTTEILFFSSP